MSNHLLTGLLYCGKCGAKLRYQKWGGGKVKLYCYSQQSSRPELIKDPDCDNLRYDASEVENAVIDNLFRYIEPVALTDHKGTHGEIRRRTSGTDVLKQRIDIVSEKIKRLYNLYAESENKLLLETIKENQEELAIAMKMLDDENKSLAVEQDVSETQETLKDLPSKWNSLDIRTKRRILRTCIDKITITDGAIDIYYKI